MILTTDREFQRFLCKGIAAFGFCVSQNKRVTYYRTTFPYFLSITLALWWKKYSHGRKKQVWFLANSEISCSERRNKGKKKNMLSQKVSPTPSSTSSPKKNPKTLHEMFLQESPHFIIPSSPSGNEELLSAISYCTFVFTFSDPSESPAQRDSKRLQLTRLVSILKSSKKPVHEKVLGPLVAMISANLFRPLPPPSNPTSNSITELPEEEDPISIFSPLWSHLQIVYEILLKLVNSTTGDITTTDQ